MGKTEGQKLEEKLCFKPQHIAKERPEDLQKAMDRRIWIDRTLV